MKPQHSNGVCLIANRSAKIEHINLILSIRECYYKFLSGNQIVHRSTLRSISEHMETRINKDHSDHSFVSKSVTQGNYYDQYYTEDLISKESQNGLRNVGKSV